MTKEQACEERSPSQWVHTEITLAVNEINDSAAHDTRSSVGTGAKVSPEGAVPDRVAKAIAPLTCGSGPTRFETEASTCGFASSNVWASAHTVQIKDR